MDKLKEAFGRVDRFSLENANGLCDEVERIEDTLLGDASKGEASGAFMNTALQRIRDITEVLVWMDRHHDEWFERVMERNVMNTLERLITNGLMPAAVKLQSLQCVTVLLQNLSRTSSLFYVCSNNHINRMVAVEFDIHDDEFVSLYVSFLKSLALRCTPDTVQFFFDVQSDAFPLWDRAVRLLSSDDAMVRTAAKQIIVTVAQLRDAAVLAFVSKSINDVFRSVLRFIDAQLMRLASTLPSWGPPASSAQPRQQPTLVNLRATTVQLEDLEDELLYVNDLCRTPVPRAGEQAGEMLRQVLFPRLYATVEAEVGSSQPASPGRPSSSNVAYAPASTALAFLLYWIHVNTDSYITTALVCFFLQPPAHSTATSQATVATLVLESPRVDLHEVVVEVCRYAQRRVQQAAAAAPATAVATPTPASSLLRPPTSLAQFFYADTPHQQTGRIIVGGPGTTILPPKATFVQKAWPYPPPPTTAVTAVTALLPHIVAALYGQLKYFQVTRLRCLVATLALLLEVLPVDSPDAPSRTTHVYVELMKLVQRRMLECVKQYASAIQAAAAAQAAADGDVPLSRISFVDIIESVDEEAVLPIRDPYAAFFLKLKEAAQWIEAVDAAAGATLQLCSTAGAPPPLDPRKDLHVFCPGFPLLSQERSRLALNPWPPLLPMAYQQQPRDAAEWVVAYQATQESVVRAFDYTARSPVSEGESELSLYVAFLLIRRAFAALGGRGLGEEVLHATLQQLRPRHEVSTYFTLAESTVDLSVRCELTSEWHPDSYTPPIAPLGTPVCLVVPCTTSVTEGRELLLLEIPACVPEHVRVQDLRCGEFKRRVLCSLDLAFVAIALHPQLAFKVVVSYQLPGHMALLHLVTADAPTARRVVTDVEKAATACRQHGASLCFGLTNYRSALIDV